MLVHLGVVIASMAGCAGTDRSVKPSRDYRVAGPIIPVESAVIAPEESPWQNLGNGGRRKVYFNDQLTVAPIEISGGDSLSAPVGWRGAFLLPGTLSDDIIMIASEG